MCAVAERPRTYISEISRVVGGGLIALFCALIIAALTFFGVINTTVGHACMALAWVVGSLLICTEILPGKPTRRKVWSVIGLAVVILVGDRSIVRMKAHEDKLAHSAQSAALSSGLPPVRRAHLHVDSFEFLKMTPGKPIGINIFYRNDGDGDMVDQHVYALIARTAPASAPADAKTVEDYLWDKFTNSPRQPVSTTHAVPAHSMGLWTTLYGEALTARQIRTLRRGGATIWFMGSAVYSDSIGEQTTDFCVYYNGNPKVVFSCSSHNSDVTPPRTS